MWLTKMLSDDINGLNFSNCLQQAINHGPQCHSFDSSYITNKGGQ